MLELPDLTTPPSRPTTAPTTLPPTPTMPPTTAGQRALRGYVPSGAGSWIPRVRETQWMRCRDGSRL